MLEVHPPHKTIETLKEFMLHLLTITVGLLIAVGIERIVEWRHQVHLVEQARETLRTEIQENVKKLDAAITEIEKRKKEMDANLAFLSPVVSSKKDFAGSDVPLTVNYSDSPMQDTSWRTAQQTGVLAYMPYSEAQIYSAIYATQDMFRARQEVVAEDWVRVLGSVRKFNLDKSNRLSPDQAATLAEQFGVWHGHLTLLHLLARSAAESEHAFLEGRPANPDMGENLFDRKQ